MDDNCKCPMAISLTGDGCRYCQPQEYIDRLVEQAEDDQLEIERLEAELERLRGECLKATNWLIERDNTIRELRAALEEDPKKESRISRCRRCGESTARYT